MKRGGGRRYYRVNDIDLLRGIRRLLYDKGFTIKGMQRILREKGVAHVASVGRGEIEGGVDSEAGVPKVEKTVAPVADRMLQGDTGAASSGLSKDQVEELKLALTDLAAARRILANRK